MVWFLEKWISLVLLQKGRERDPDLFICRERAPDRRPVEMQARRVKTGGREEGSMGFGIEAVVVLVAAWLATAPPCALASSRRFNASIRQENLVNSTSGSTAATSGVFDPSKSKRLSWHPRVFLYEGFLSDMECGHLVSMARGNMKPSSVVTDGDSNSSYNNIEDTVVSKIEDRISLWSFLPKEYGESIQVFKYGVNKSDSVKDEPKSGNGSHRLVTILMYVSDVKQGGETVFPRSEMKDAQAKEGALSQCSGYAVRPAKGNAILLFNLKPDGEPDKDSQYEECSVLEGEKWLAIKHIHLRKNDYPKSSLASEDECTDEDDRCVSWAASGECDRNPVFMMGSPDYYGSCRKSCRVC